MLPEDFFSEQGIDSLWNQTYITDSLSVRMLSPSRLTGQDFSFLLNYSFNKAYFYTLQDAYIGSCILGISLPWCDHRGRKLSS